MATITRAQLIERVLQNLGVLAAGQTPSAEDSFATGEAIDSVYARLQRDEKAPFTLSAIPEWAQPSLRDVVSYELKDVFGISGERLQSIGEAYARGTQQISKQTSVQHDPRIRQRARYY